MSKGPMDFTYLDLVDPSILFQPVMAQNWVQRDEGAYSIFSMEEHHPTPLPGYLGQRCIIEKDMAVALAAIQKQLKPLDLSLKVYDAYRPQKTVDFFMEWMKTPDTPMAKKYHYPQEPKALFHELSYLSRTSSHTLGTAVDLTLASLTPQPRSRPQDFLGIWDPESLDMGVGYLAFDKRSSHAYEDLTEAQKKNRTLLRQLMVGHGFEELDTEFWHYYYGRSRNKDHFYDMDIRDDYDFGR